MTRTASKVKAPSIPVFVTWADIAPSLVHLAASEADAREWCNGYSTATTHRLQSDRGEAVLLDDIISDPHGNGVGCKPGGLD